MNPSRLYELRLLALNVRAFALYNEILSRASSLEKSRQSSSLTEAVVSLLLARYELELARLVRS